MLNQLRVEQSSMIAAAESESSGVEAHAGDNGPGNKTVPESWQAERTKLKVTATATFTKTVVLAGTFVRKKQLLENVCMPS